MHDTKLQIISFYWKPDSFNKIHQPYVELRANDSEVSKHIQLSKYIFNWKLSKIRYCPGYHLLDQYYPCTRHIQLNKHTDTICNGCEHLQGFKDAFFFKKEGNDAIQKYLSRPHYVYLAMFGHNRIKVGTASENRKFIRLVEQDSSGFIHLLKLDNAFDAQRFERIISKEFHITESVSSKVKYKVMCHAPNSDIINKLLSSKVNEIKKVHKDWPYNDNLETKSTNKIADIFYPDAEVFNVDDSNLFGMFKGLRGRYMILEESENQELISFDVRNLIGRNIEDYLEDYKYGIYDNHQMSLI